jgi:glycosyltransferase involved in cell wall biosynthesis
MEKTRVLYLCSAVDEETKTARHILFNNSAATNKVIGIAKALQNQKLELHVISLGRGKQSGSQERFPVLEKTVVGILFHYAAFWHIPLFSHIISAFSQASLVRKLINGYQGKIILIAYNRQWHYLPSLIQARIFRTKIYLDLEDGNTPSGGVLSKIINRIRVLLFDYFCPNGAILAAKALNDQIKTRNTFVCYGCAETDIINKERSTHHQFQILFGGSLLVETGAQLLIDTITWLNVHHPELKKDINIIVTGYGPMSLELSQFSKSIGRGWIQFLGDIDRDTYLEVLKETQIGLCLKLNSTQMGRTTFPSKILEYASYGLAIITTKVSDVPELLQADGAIYLEEETPEKLAEILQLLANNTYNIQDISNKGQEIVRSKCNSEVVGNDLKQFLLKDA